MPPETMWIVMTALPDVDVAARIARELVEARLAACVTQLAVAQSIYRWQGRVEQATEYPLIIKTTAARHADVIAFLRAAHPYELPEIVALPVVAGLPDYLMWVASESREGGA
jgi:periplasmic divalent cation tolerance protein